MHRPAAVPRPAADAIFARITGHGMRAIQWPKVETGEPSLCGALELQLRYTYTL